MQTNTCYFSLWLGVLLMGVLGIAPSAYALTLTFEEIGVNNSTRDINTYQGFTFSVNQDVIDIGTGSTWDDTGPAVSGDYANLNNNGGTGIITKADGGNFSFQELHVRSWFTGNQGSGKTIVGIRDGVQVASVSFSMTTSWQRVEANFEDIDRLELRFGNHYLVDDMVFDAANDTNAIGSPSAVPELNSLLLVGMAILGMGIFRKSVS